MFGKKTFEWEISLSNHTSIKLKHPSSALYKNKKWDGENVFNKINLHLKNQGKSLIKW